MSSAFHILSKANEQSKCRISSTESNRAKLCLQLNDRMPGHNLYRPLFSLQQKLDGFLSPSDLLPLELAAHPKKCLGLFFLARLYVPGLARIASYRGAVIVRPRRSIGLACHGRNFFVSQLVPCKSLNS